MVTSADIMRATGIKNIKTLTRWHQQGVIPKPTVGTSPSGRGKMAYWPDWVLERCVKIVDLQKQGHSLHSAVALLESERFGDALNEALQTPRISGKAVKFGDGRTLALGDLFAALTVQMVKPVVSSDTIPRVVSGMREKGALDTAIGMLRSGYNPVLVVESAAVRIVPDFVVSHALSAMWREDGEAIVSISLVKPLKKLFATIGKEFEFEPVAGPAPKIWAYRSNGEVTETTIFPCGGPLGFELLRNTETVVNPSK